MRLPLLFKVGFWAVLSITMFFSLVVGILALGNPTPADQENLKIFFPIISGGFGFLLGTITAAMAVSKE